MHKKFRQSHALGVPEKEFTSRKDTARKSIGMLQSKMETVSDFPPYFCRQQTSQKYKECYEK